MANTADRQGRVREALVVATVCGGLIAVSGGNYLLFHALTELFGVVVLGGIFAIARNSRRIVRNDYVVFLGIACVFIALFQLLHTLAYKGMGVFGRTDADLATQLWVASRYCTALAFLGAALFLGRALRYHHRLDAKIEEGQARQRRAYCRGISPAAEVYWG